MKTIGGYKYNEEKDRLGKGAFGEVFKGTNQNGQVVAIKKINIRENHMKYIVQEISIIEQLEHENIVKIITAYDEQPQTIHIIMEYCNGGNLGQYLKNQGKLSKNTIKLFLSQLASALKVVRAKNIIHRDLKPENILLSCDVTNPEPSQILLKMADVGIARFLSDMNSQELGYAGTWRRGVTTYMAPEIISEQRYNAKADLYSLGVIMFECLTGKNTKPFNIPDNTSPELRDLLEGLLQEDLKQRIEFDTFFKHKFLMIPDPVFCNVM